MVERLAAMLLVALAAAGCATRPPHPDAFTFAVVGDAPYNAAEEAMFDAMMRRIDAEPLAFVVHVGDFKGSAEPCSDELYASRRAQLAASAHPLVLTPGDNDWTDCRRLQRDPIERLARLREVFFADRFALGRTRMELFVQDGCVSEGPLGCCPGLPENRFWTRGGVRFVTLHVVGSNNNVGFDAASDREARCRDEANAAWLEYVVRASQHSQTRGLAIFVHANPLDTKRDTYADLVGRVRDAARRLKRPILFVHGDTHTYRVDVPVKDALGNPVTDITRLETYGSPFVGWVRVAVDPDDPQVFSISPQLQGIAPR